MIFPNNLSLFFFDLPYFQPLEQKSEKYRSFFGGNKGQKIISWPLGAGIVHSSGIRIMLTRNIANENGLHIFNLARTPRTQLDVASYSKMGLKHFWILNYKKH